MGWLNDLLNHLRINRAVVVAAFVACLVVSVGPHYFPEQLDRAPEAWRWIVNAILAFTSTLLLVWGAAIVGRALARWWQYLAGQVALRNITVLEESLLGVLAENPNEAFDLDRFNYARSNFTKLDMVEAADGLHRKGLARREHAHSDYVKITPAGRKRVTKARAAKPESSG